MKWDKVMIVNLNKVPCHLQQITIALRVVTQKMWMKIMESLKWKYLNNSVGIFCSMMCKSPILLNLLGIEM
jgi:hypothetical protein